MTTRLGLMALLLGSVAPAAAGVEPLTLYQKTARAPLVVKARALSDSTRRPEVEVVLIYKGSCPSKIITIAPHFEDNTAPTPWLHREVFRAGVESILFLTPYVDEFGRDEGDATFAVLNADQGKVEVPAEGADALLEALHRFVEILSLGQHDLQGEALRSLLSARNPFMIEAALTECRKYHLAEKDDVKPLLSLLASQRSDFRSGALALLGQLLKDSGAFGQGGLGPDAGARVAIYEQVAATAHLDTDERVRKEAVGALEAFGDASSLVLLEEIGRRDASQSVRYAAQVSAMRLREKIR